MGVTAAANLLSALDRGSLVISSNERLRRSLTQAWDHKQRDAGLTYWEPVPVLSWRSWTQSLWTKLLVSGRVSELLLSPFQEQSVWARILGGSSGAPGNSAAMAGLASAAWGRLNAYSDPAQLQRLRSTLKGDSAVFAGWARTFGERLTSDLLLSHASLEAELAKRIRRGEISLATRQIVLAGFDVMTPAQKDLIAAAASRGVVAELAEAALPSNAQTVACSDEAEELRASARWCHQMISRDPRQRIALIIPDLQRELASVEAALQEVFLANNATIAPEENAIFEFSLGRPLAHEPMVQTAMSLLRWAVGSISISDVSELLLSPYFGASDVLHLAARSELDARLVRRQLLLRPEMTISELLEMTTSEAAPHLAVISLRATLKQMESAQSHFDLRTRGYAEWVEWMRQWLSKAAWCTAGGLSSREYQLRERWEHALETLATLDFSGRRTDLPEALRHLQALVHDTIFAPESSDAPVQILGPNEAAGSVFDAAWILRMGEFTWPPRSSPSPLLPWSLQRDSAMPGTDPLSERSLGQRITRRLAGCATYTIFSFSQRTATGGHQRAAAALRELGLAEQSLEQVVAPTESPLPAILERIAEPQAIQALPRKVHRGGSRIFELQAACGFRAFAELRLGSREPDNRSLGLNGMERGSAVHEALEEFWRDLSGQDELRSLPAEDRAMHVRHAAAKGLERARRRSKTEWDRSYLQIQQERLERLLSTWVQTELSRPEFTVMTREEVRKGITIGPLQLSVRMDRVDLVDGHQVVIDYKTGSASPKDWLSDRPDKPQIPLYAALASAASPEEENVRPPLGAVGFGQVRAGKDMRLYGFELAPGMLRDPATRAREIRMDAPTFEDQVTRWRSVLERLAVQFSEGDAQVDPKHFPATCERCTHRLVCRIDPSRLEDESELPVESESTDD